jgi:hypothetical protein
MLYPRCRSLWTISGNDKGRGIPLSVATSYRERFYAWPEYRAGNIGAGNRRSSGGAIKRMLPDRCRDAFILLTSICARPASF